MNATIENLIPAELRSADKDVCIDVQSDAIVVVGTGPVGMQFVQELTERECELPIVVYGSEPVQPYNLSLIHI